MEAYKRTKILRDDPMAQMMKKNHSREDDDWKDRHRYDKLLYKS